MTELEQKIEAYRASASELKRLMTLRLNKSTERESAISTAAKLKAALGEKILAGVLSGDESGESATIHESAMANVKADSLGEVVAALDLKIADQQRLVHQAHAAVIRGDAQRLRAEAEVAQRPVDALLKQLLELAGVEFEPKRNKPAPMPMMVVNGKATNLPSSPANGGAPMLVVRNVTHVERMIERADELEQAAIAVEQGGSVPANPFTGYQVKLPNYLEQPTPIPALAMEMEHV